MGSWLVRSKKIRGLVSIKNLSRLGALVVVGILALGFIQAITPSMTSSTSPPVIVQNTPGTMDSSLARMGPRNPYTHVINFGSASQAPGCSGNPCPMGLVDYGISNNLASYSYNAKQVLGRVDVSRMTLAAVASNTPICIDHYANPRGIAHCFTLQLNWVSQNMYDGRNKQGDYWAQGVVQIGYDQTCASPCVSGRFSATFLDNVWNFSSPVLDHSCGVSGEQGCMESGFHGGIGCTTSNPGSNYYACVAPIVYNLVPPFSIVIKINVNACGPSGTISCFLFSGQVHQAGADLFNSAYDAFEFTNSLHTTARPSFHISGTGHPPYPLPWDGEWVAAGACCGLSYSPEIDATWQEFYSTSATSTAPGSYVSIKHAWSSGLDTSESVATVEMYGFGGAFDSATSIFNSDNPATNLW